MTNLEEFRFENTVKLTEQQYVAVWKMLPKLNLARTIAIAAIGIGFLFISYTLLLGLVVLGFLAVMCFIPEILPFGMRSLFRKHKYLRDALTYGVSDQKLWVKGGRIDASVSWSMLVSWHQTEEWLVLSPSGIPPLYLSLARLRAEGVYGRVRALAASNGTEWHKSVPKTSE